MNPRVGAATTQRDTWTDRAIALELALAASHGHHHDLDTPAHGFAPAS
jgi:hypothetical protein